MTILFVLLTFIVVIGFKYFVYAAENVPAEVEARPRMQVRAMAPVMTKEAGFDIPKGYGFHPGHTWVLREGRENARVGLDKFAADLIGTIDRIDVPDESRWVRQGQRLATLHSNNVSVDLLSPVEGVVMAINKDVLAHPELALRDPYKDGWIAILKSPDLPTNQKNLMQGSMVAPWMHYSITRLNSAAAQSNPALAQDGGFPMGQGLASLPQEVREKLLKDFLLN